MGKWGHCWDIMEFFLIYEIHGLFCMYGICLELVWMKWEIKSFREPSGMFETLRNS